MARSRIGTVGSLKEDARHSITDALKVQELHVTRVKEDILVGNSRGLNLANLAHRLDTELAAQNEKIATLKAELEMADSRQEERLSYLLRSDDCYRLVRDRYLSTFKTDHLGIHTKTDKKIIANGNVTAHWGDAIVDSSLYAEPDGRMDVEVFQKLYGVLPKTMEGIRDEKTIYVLNTHAGILSSNFKKGSRKFSNLFAKFIKALEKSGFDETYLDGKDTDVTRAYRAFVDCIGKEVKGVRPKRR
ncbi:hypothetical protein L873DRAFT_1808803 [Choiromyces venosus 120613-1]|uniref:Uncharacterized protein n=1 Tax=Choiromyces venosus 120613-1 TaxID=1336337 RepID=A0A3N4JN34_9PEZI|nr:hypothetical protein L873DRAFT_1808803 [Choiromyces venosus 120613-1]